jgi:hypothetical protein
MTLAELELSFEAIETAIAQADGEITPENADVLASLNLAEKDKLDGYALYLRTLEGDVATYKSLRDELQAKEKTVAGKIDWLKTRLRQHMALRETTEMRGDIYKFRLVKAGKPPVEVLVAPEDLPRSFCTVKVTPNLDLIREAIMQGTVSPDIARLGECTLSLRIS